MLEQYVFPQVDQIEEENNVIFQQDGAPPHFSLETLCMQDSLIGGLVGPVLFNGLLEAPTRHP